MNTKKLYNITASKEQLEVIQKACDLFARIQLGQWDRMFDYLPLQKELDYEQLHRIQDIIGAMMPGILKDEMDGRSASFGVAHPELPKTNGVAFDVSDCIRHKLSWEDAVEKGVVESEDSPRDWDQMLGVRWDTPMHWGDEDLIKIQRVT